MKKIFTSIVAVFVVAVSWATTRTAGNATEFENAWQTAEDGDVIKLAADITITKTLWLGTANMNDAAKSITLDLNGYTLQNVASLKYMFFITHGELNVISSQPGGMIIQDQTNNEELFRLTGSTYKNVNPKITESGYFTHLTIGEGVSVKAMQKNAIVIDQLNAWPLTASNAIAAGGEALVTSLPYNTTVYTNSMGVAHGVRVDIYGNVYGEKYAFKANGNLQPPSSTPKTDLSDYWEDPAQTIAYTVNSSDTAYSPFIHIYSMAELRVPETNDITRKPVAVYCSGYARWLIEGTCVGSTGVYIKEGVVDIHDATIESNYTGEYVAVSAMGSGVAACGSAVAIEYNSAYSIDLEVNISGDTQLSATSGYAIDASVTSATETKVDVLTITGGTLDGGQVPDPDNSETYVQGTIKISEQASDGEPSTIAVIDGQVRSTGEWAMVTDAQSLADYLCGSESSTHITFVERSDGGVTMIVSEGTAPVLDNSVLAGHDAGSSIQWTGEYEELIADLELQELDITQQYAQTLTIQSGKSLTVQRVILGTSAKIIVEPGAKLVLKGTQGIISSTMENIVLHTSDSAQAQVLINPNTTSNTHPKATVDFISRSYYQEGTGHRFQRFAIPTYSTPEVIYDENINTRIWAYSDALDAWQDLDFASDHSTLNTPFAVYNMMTYTPYPGHAFTMKGNLYGTTNATLNMNLRFNGFANSYSADINIAQLINRITTEYTNVSGTIYLYDNEMWYEINNATPYIHPEYPSTIAPMQSFVLQKRTATATNVTINYNSAVWEPAMASLAPAPARNSSFDYTSIADITITGETGRWDKLLLIEGDRFSSEFDNSYDADKYMNDDVNLYAHSYEKMAILATDNLADTYLGFSTVKGGEFTMRFKKVEGREFDLIDLETGVRVAVSEGETYTFSAGKRTVADFRFKVVERENVATSIEATDAPKNAKGIYTVMGQYVGEMNEWNSLPAGVYIVNGKKSIK